MPGGSSKGNTNQPAKKSAKKPRKKPTTKKEGKCYTHAYLSNLSTAQKNQPFKRSKLKPLLCDVQETLGKHLNNQIKGKF